MMRTIIAGLALATVTIPTQAAVLEVQPVSQTVHVGDSVVVNITGSGFSGILGGGFNLSYGASGVLSLGSSANVSLAAPPWDGTFARIDSVSDTTGTLTDFSFNQINGVSGSTQIAQLTFQATAKGVANLALSASNSFPFVDMSGNPVLDVQFGTGQVTVRDAVPEPASWALLVVGLGLIVLLVGRRQSLLHS